MSYFSGGAATATAGGGGGGGGGLHTKKLHQHPTTHNNKNNHYSGGAQFRHQHRLAAGSGGASLPHYPSLSEPLLDVQKKVKKRSIAGIDQEELVDPSELADPDSCFLEFKGVHIHHKIYEHHEDQTSYNHTTNSSVIHYETAKLGFPIILLHGFGASLFSWARAMKPLAQATASRVVAFDRPAFGLTTRSSMATQVDKSSPTNDEDLKSLNPYSTAFSVLATLAIINFLAADKAILIGHSAGSLVAVNAYFDAPERVAALILVAPAIVAPRTPGKDIKKNQMQGENQSEGNNPSNTQQNPFIMIVHTLSKLSMYLINPIVRMLKGMVLTVSYVYKKALTAFLRSTVALMLLRMVLDKFGIAAIRNAWYDANKVTNHVLDGYTKPLRIKDWDKALLEYTVAMLTDSAPGPPLSKRLKDITCPVLIITGDCDRLIPSWNAEKLSRAIPSSNLEVIKNCGHLPHEEKVEEFVSVVQKFLQRVFGAQNEQILQAAS